MAETKVNQSADTQPALNQKEAFILKYKNWFIGGVIALIVIIVAIVFFKNQADTKQEEAATASAVGQDTYFADGESNMQRGIALIDSANFEKALKGDGQFKGFIKIADEYSSTKAGNLANLYAGLCYANLNNWQEAAKYLEQFDDAGDIMVSPAALGALGNAYAHLNQLDKAVETLKKAADKADNIALSPVFLVQAGEILESQNKKEEALKLYQRVKAMDRTDIQTPYQDVIDEYIERVSQ